MGIKPCDSGVVIAYQVDEFTHNWSAEQFVAHSYIYPGFTFATSLATLVAFGFWSSTPPDNIALTPANRKADQSLSEFQTGIGATAHATLNTEQLISHLRVAFVDTISSLLDSEEGVIPASEVHELLIKVHDILDNAVSKLVGNSAHILVYVFNSASRQHREVWTS